MKKILNRLKSDRGITGTDISIAIIVIVVFTGVISKLMYNSYANGVEIQISANASCYATIILEKVDEKPFDEITSNFVLDLINDKVIDIDPMYSVYFYVEDLTYMYKKVTVKILYSINNKQQDLTISKIKVNEAGVQ